MILLTGKNFSGLKAAVSFALLVVFVAFFFADGVGFYDQGGGRAAVGAAGKP